METTANLPVNRRQRRWSDRADIASNCRGRLVAITAMSVAIVGWLILDQVSSMVGQEQIVLVNNAVEDRSPALPLSR